VRVAPRRDKGSLGPSPWAGVTWLGLAPGLDLQDVESGRRRTVGLSGYISPRIACVQNNVPRPSHSAQYTAQRPCPHAEVREPTKTGEYVPLEPAAILMCQPKMTRLRQSSTMPGRVDAHGARPSTISSLRLPRHGPVSVDSLKVPLQPSSHLWTPSLTSPRLRSTGAGWRSASGSSMKTWTSATKS
jgi:hypothetical protein